jgi:Flp pilus assembly pilin Flp
MGNSGATTIEWAMIIALCGIFMFEVARFFAA